MIAQLEKIIPSTNQSFFFRKFEVPYFDAPFHYHPELELTYIERGKGKRYIGEHVTNFESGDLVLLGPQVPHCWLCDSQDPEDPQTSISYVVQFSRNFLTPDGFSPIPEFEHLTPVFQKAARGVLILHKSRTAIAQILRSLPALNFLERLTALLRIFTILAESPEDLHVLENRQTYDALSNENREKLQKIYRHVIAHYPHKITLAEVAALVNLSPNAFCRFFKQLTGKTLTDVINGYRVDHALHLLKTSDLNISEIAYDSGFQTVPYFNTVFKKAMQCSPTEYRGQVAKAKRDPSANHEIKS
ncbi:AraC family transcriptional regulator [Salmonirosea aquatica]|uniref:Helix-turn-helix domain-containing protein n=1 Tax=Salmonirosea aquatica TaxID=2654236 RepID=A0A7C9FQU3_9BACT|nr:helix-turn-helix domain-containing protein [Cytophagaceae bacterium SJW1-29]